MISIGAIIGGPEASYFSSILNKFMQYCENLPDRPNEAKVNIVYHLSGSMLSPDYVGVRSAKFSKKTKHLMVQAAVEAELNDIRDKEEIIEYIKDVADEAIGIAKTKFEQAGIDYPIEVDRKLISDWRN